MSKSTQLAPTAPFRWLNRIRGLCVLISSISMVVMILSFAWLVFGRYVLNASPTWVEQLSLILICYITFLGTAVGIHDDTHLGVQFIREAMPVKIRRSLRILAEGTVGLFGLTMLIAGMELVQFGWSTNLAMLNIPEGVRTLPAAICGGLIFIFSLARVYLMVLTFHANEHEPKRSEPTEQDR